MMEQAGAELDVDPVGGVSEQVGPQDAENGLEQSDRQKADHQHVKRAQRAMDQNLVDHDLEEKRRGEREQLQEKGCDEHLAEKVPIFVYRAQEPSEIETSAKVAQSRPSSHQDQAAVPDRKQFVAGHQGRAGSLWPLHQNL